jgi:hypothetical protein
MLLLVLLLLVVVELAVARVKPAVPQSPLLGRQQMLARGRRVCCCL